jgi:hypothetical protein
MNCRSAVRSSSTCSPGSRERAGLWANAGWQGPCWREARAHARRAGRRRRGPTLAGKGRAGVKGLRSTGWPKASRANAGGQRPRRRQGPTRRDVGTGLRTCGVPPVGPGGDAGVSRGARLCQATPRLPRTCRGPLDGDRREATSARAQRSQSQRARGGPRLRSRGRQVRALGRAQPAAMGVLVSRGEDGRESARRSLVRAAPGRHGCVWRLSK